MIFFKIINKNEVLFSNLNSTPREASVRKVYRNINGYDIELWGSDYDYKILGNKHIADKTAEAYIKIVQFKEGLQNEYGKEYAIASHNLITAHSLLQDTIEKIIPEFTLVNAENYYEQVNIVKNILIKDQQTASEGFLSIIKRSVDIQAQIEGLKILSGTKQINIGKHNIDKALKNIVHPFYDDFNKRNIEIKYHIDFDDADDNPLETDYKILNMALHHILNNAIKYTLPYTPLHIGFDSKTRTLYFEMMSVKIENDEIDKIIELGYRGRNIDKNDPGEGVGMYMVKKALDLINATIKIESDHNTETKDIFNKKYTKNKFLINFI
jgi:light-regulated signal transduction histidine kinase (bacteriophytochrome)